jgi:uncharacterized membrane protein YhhN
MLALLAYSGESGFHSKYRLRCALGLAFGGIGDFLLSTNELGFHLGSISFAIGHICYIVSKILRFFNCNFRLISLLYYNYFHME